ncbi:MAG: hypothetical protein AABX85_00040 [Nanoarchaeota archaeon]
MNLIDKIRSKTTGKVAAPLLASSFFLTGCGTIFDNSPNANQYQNQQQQDNGNLMDALDHAAENFWSNLFGNPGVILHASGAKLAQQGKFDQAIAVDALGNLQDASYQRNVALEAARESRSTVNVTVNPPQQPQQQTQNNFRTVYKSLGKTPYSVAFLDWVDRNNDSIFQLNEFEGASDSFNLRCVKEVTFGTQILNRKGDFVSFDLYTTNPDNPEISTPEHEIASNNRVISYPVTDKLFREKGMKGRCTVNFMIRNANEPERYKKVFDSYSVTILDEP